MTVVMFAASQSDWVMYQPHLMKAFLEVGVDAELTQSADPSSVEYIIYAPDSKLQDFSPYRRLKAVLNLWAGVEGVVGNETLNVPLARMVDGGLTEGMVEWCVGHVMRHHLDTDRDVLRSDQQWQPHVPPLARDRQIGILGLGELGTAVAQTLMELNFQVCGWSRSQKRIRDLECRSSDDGLIEILSSAEILVLLLPLTAGTRDILNKDRLALMPKGAVVINPGRGPLIDDAALLAALDSGHLGHATLDVFREEPLPREHPFWINPRVTVTPHVAAATRVESAARVVAENVRRGEAGEPFVHLVDRHAGY
ncbi:MAG: glyoxylate/hydroxypyruvate reductase A [Boseongicola sp.]|nr:MAG: glyoxylate/hydroxypyruvate reductase A [Boseongicola sp.]